MTDRIKYTSTAERLQIGELADQLGQRFYERIAESHEVTYQQVKQWREQYLSGFLQRRLQIEEFYSQTYKRVRHKSIDLRPLLSLGTEKPIDK